MRCQRFPNHRALLPHFEEEVIGAPNALLDNVTLLRRLNEVAPDITVTVEHYPDEKIPAAAAGIRRAAEIAGSYLGLKRTPLELESESGLAP